MGIHRDLLSLNPCKVSRSLTALERKTWETNRFSPPSALAEGQSTKLLPANLWLLSTRTPWEVRVVCYDALLKHKQLVWQKSILQCIMKVNSVNKKIRMHIKVPKVTTESIYSIYNFQTSRGKERKFRVGSEAGRGKLNPSKRQELKKTRKHRKMGQSTK